MYFSVVHFLYIETFITYLDKWCVNESQWSFILIRSSSMVISLLHLVSLLIHGDMDTAVGISRYMVQAWQYQHCSWYHYWHCTHCTTIDTWFKHGNMDTALSISITKTFSRNLKILLQQKAVNTVTVVNASNYDVRLMLRCVHSILQGILLPTLSRMHTCSA